MCGVLPSSTYSATVSSLGVKGCWGTSAILRAISRGEQAATSCPPSEIEPVNGTSPASARKIVVFPAPFGPITVTHSPGSMITETFRTT